MADLKPTSNSILVSIRSWKSDETYALIRSNISVVNAMRDDLLYFEEMPREALLSYYVDYYLAQVNNGGFSQFVYNSRWSLSVRQCIEEGLIKMRATQHLALFHQISTQIEALGEDTITEYLQSVYWGENPIRDHLNKDNRVFYSLEDQEDLIQLNAIWLRFHPDLVVLSFDEIEAEIARRVQILGPEELEARRLNRLAGEPRYFKVVKVLCGIRGLEFEQITSGRPDFCYQGQSMMAWHFRASGQGYYLVDLGDRVALYDGKLQELIDELILPEEFHG